MVHFAQQYLRLERSRRLDYRLQFGRSYDNFVEPVTVFDNPALATFPWLCDVWQELCPHLRCSVQRTVGHLVCVLEPHDGIFDMEDEFFFCRLYSNVPFTRKG